MLIRLFSQILGFILAVGLQVFVLNNLEVNGLINPFYYLIFILLLPFETSKAFLIILGFITGITVDIFSQTIGLHAGASVLMAFLRPFVLDMILPRENMEAQTSPSLRILGFQDFLKYIFLLVFIHHTFLFVAEVFRFNDFIFTLLRIFISTVFSVIMIVISQLIFSKA